MNVETKKARFFKELWTEFSNGTSSNKLGIVSSLFTVSGVSGAFFYTNLSIGKILNLDLFQLSILFLLTTLLIVFSLLIIGGMVYASTPKNFNLDLSFLFFVVLILTWGMGLALLSVIFAFYMEIIDLLFNRYVK
ncbi:hypothetical protein [Paenibacillus terrae]|uniref:Uncharacterized protein n=1 Tax=Paenibacillus terrae TaxID=159743 RepID=A0A0D7X6V0_9BACL|nr:hypothetical protein [Paenibacillus terrae]KJD47136.1 hypothetical protein QD47_03005 [Paenibacillus terrae]